jgi:hypothetical protein
MPLLILTFIFFFFTFFNDTIWNFLEKLKLVEEAASAEVDEKLGTYFECLTPF